MAVQKFELSLSDGQYRSEVSPSAEPGRTVKLFHFLMSRRCQLPYGDRRFLGSLQAGQARTTHARVNFLKLTEEWSLQLQGQRIQHPLSKPEIL